MITKGDKAHTAHDVALELFGDPDAHPDVAIEVGRWSVMARYHGYLSTKQVNEELARTTQRLGHVFADRYVKRLKETA